MRKMPSFDDVIMSICQIIANDVRVNGAWIPSTQHQSPKELQGIDYDKWNRASLVKPEVPTRATFPITYQCLIMRDLC